MSRRIRITTGEAAALHEARFRCRMDDPSELLSAALEGDERAMGALRDEWPDRSMARAEVARLRHEAAAAGAELDSVRVGEIAARIAEIEAEHPGVDQPEPYAWVTMDGTVIDQLVDLARSVPRSGPGRPSAADGIRIMLNGGQAEEADA